MLCSTVQCAGVPFIVIGTGFYCTVCWCRLLMVLGSTVQCVGVAFIVIGTIVLYSLLGCIANGVGFYCAIWWGAL